MSLARGWARHRALLFVIALAGSVLTGLLLSGGAAPASANKNYAARIAPTTAPGSAATAVTVTIENCGPSSAAPCSAATASTQSLGSANVTFPSGFALPQGPLAASAVTASGGKTWSATVSGNTIELRNPGPSTTNALAPGEHVSVTITVTTPAGCGWYQLSTQAKQSNDFNGPPGNAFNLVGSQPALTVSPGGTLDHFVVSPVTSPQTAGAGFTVTATAYDSCGAVKTNYAGGAALSGTIATSPNGTVPVYGSFGAWTNGSASATVTAYATTSFGTGGYKPDFTVTVADGAASGTSNGFAVTPGPLGSFTIGSIASPQTAGTAFPVTATAYDLYGNLKRDYAGGAALSGNLANAPDGTAPLYGSFGSWTNGTATASATAYAATPLVGGSHAAVDTVTVSDGAVSATSSSFAVAPGALGRFAWTGQPGAAQAAGTSFTAAVTAYDTYGNVKDDYTPASAVFSGLGTSPAGFAPSYSVSWSGGVGSGTFVDDKAESGARLTVTDGSVTASSSSFDVAPGPLGSFTWQPQPGASQTAGVAFAASVTAADAYGNAKTDYTGAGASFGGLATSPGGYAPISSVSWSNGVGTGTFTDYTRETTKLTVGDGTVQSSSSSFSVAAGPVQTLSFVQQPGETQVGTSISPAVTVKALDAYGNTVPGAAVGVSLTAISGTGSFKAGSTTTATTDSSGVATFSNLAVTDTGEYQLVATSGSASATSIGFVIANQVNPCSGSCSASGSVKNNTTTDASATGAPSGSSLAVSVILNDTPPPAACTATGFTPLGAGSFVNILGSGGATPTFTITWTLDKSIVNAVPNNGASQFDICLGAVNLLDPSGGSTTGWTTKDGTPAVGVFDPNLGVTLFWGILPDCPKTPTGPCVLSRHKDKAGDEIVQFLKPAPWDGHFAGGN
ncbi:MAG TPA: hypothetical protein VFA44_13890 [Gaiellaceae bacterium]|nr:hypothetical protein [Gaiellaceae bacterium]